MIYKIFHSQTKSMTSAAFILGISMLASRFLGLIRDRLLAGRFGAGEESDIYFAAFRIPDFIYGIIIMGGLSAIFLPIFSELNRHSKEEGWRFVNNTLNVILVTLIIICGLLLIFTPWLINLVAPGFSDANKNLAIDLTRIMLLSPILLGISSVFSGILQYFNQFLAYSLAPILYNIGIISGIIFFVPVFGLKGLAYGVIFGAFLHLAIQIPSAMHNDWRFQRLLSFQKYGAIKLFRLIVPRIIGTSSYQFNLFFLTAIASTLGTGAISIFNYSNNLQYLPIGLIGISVATATFPALSRSWAANDKKAFWEQLSSALRQIFFIVIPASILMILLRAHIVRIIFGWGEFGWEDTRLVAASLAAFAIGIFAAASIPVIARAFFAMHDTKTPAVLGLFTTILNIMLAVTFIKLTTNINALKNIIGGLLKIHDLTDFSVVGIAFSISITTIVQFLLLIILLRRKLRNAGLDVENKSLLAFGKMFTAGLGLSVTAYAFLKLGGKFLDTHTFLGIFWQTSIAAISGLTAYLFIATKLKMEEIRNIKKLLKFWPRANGTL